MKREQLTRWVDDEGDDLIVQESLDTFRVIPASCGLKRLKELGEAIQDVIRRDSETNGKRE